MAQRAFDRSISFPQQGETSADGGGTTTTPATSTTMAGGPTSSSGANPNILPMNTTSTGTTATTKMAWINDDLAEEDQVLAVLSEGAEIYLRSVLEKALHCARQRQNVDGLRLWHQQYIIHNKESSSSSTTAAASPEKSDTSPDQSGPNRNDKNDAEQQQDRPALSLRLGCNIVRQVARAAGNAATLCHRAEQALRRQQQKQQQPLEGGAVTPEILARASSLSDVALRPRLRQAVEEADAEAKRQFDVYGGRDAEEPFGRLPKRAKLEVIDFKNGMNFARPGRRRHRASTNSSSFHY